MTKDKFLEFGSKLILLALMLMFVFNTTIILAALYQYGEEALGGRNLARCIGVLTIICYQIRRSLQKYENKPIWLPLLRLLLWLLVFEGVIGLLYASVTQRIWWYLPGLMLGYIVGHDITRLWINSRQRTS